jgi:UDP:flavonoid glycosyltransferase YjiC (YdhE family)/SAM-dependent methyltransferase
MRILFCVRPFHGHVAPMLPTATALRRAGHDVAFATAPSFESAITEVKMPFVPAGEDPRRTAPDQAGGRDWGEMVTRSKLKDLLSQAAGRRPDVIIREQTDFAGLLAAEILSVPCVTLGPAMFIPPRSWHKLLGGMLDRIRAEYRIAADPAHEHLHPSLYLDVVPPSWQLPEAAGIHPRQLVRPVASPAEDWEPPSSDRPLAYVTLGTVYNRRPGLLGRLVEGAIAAGFEVVATTGPEVDPASLDIPENGHLHLHTWLPQADVMRRCDVVIAHGGFNTTIGALAHGLPLLVVPLGSDNPVHARRCRQLGVGLTLDVADADPERIRGCLQRLMEEPRWSDAAERMSREIAGMPSADLAVPLIEQLGDARPRRAGRPPRRTAVIIPAYRPQPTIRPLLLDIATEPWVDVVVVDNSGQYEPFGTERVLRPGANLGWAGGCNLGLATLEDQAYDAYVLLNGDTRLSRGFFDGLWRAWEGTGAALLGPVYDGVWPHQASEHSRGPAGYRPCARHRHVPFVEGTCMFLPRATVAGVGRLDATTFPGHGWGVDFDYALRVRDRGGEVCVTELAFLHHDVDGLARARDDGWALSAWDEMVAGMRRKWGQAWPGRLRSAAGVCAEGPGVLVLGSPGSGASAVTRALERMGVAPVPADLAQALEDVNRTLTAEPPVAEPFEVLATPESRQALVAARAELAPRLPRGVWLWRDPRNNFLVPFWSSALDAPLLTVLVVREPGEVAAALNQSLGWAPERALAFWERSTRHVLKGLVGLPVLVIRHDEPVVDPDRWATDTDAFLRQHGAALSRNGGAHDEQGPPATPSVVTPSREQQQLFAQLVELRGAFDRFPDLTLGAETPRLEAYLRGTPVTANGKPLRLAPEWIEWVTESCRGGRQAEALQVLIERGVSPAEARVQVAQLANRSAEPAYRSANRAAWKALADDGSEFTVPYGREQLAQARELLDTPLALPWNEIDRVLCLAGGGGQQGPLFASLGARVTVADLSPAQLQRDRDAAAMFGLHLDCAEADMLDLRALEGEFDLVHQPVSTCYVPDLAALHAEVARVLRPRGHYWVEHWNPVRMQVEDLGRWSPYGYRLIRRQAGVGPIRFDDLPGSCVHFIHPLDRLIGSLMDAGFVVVGFAERRFGDASASPGSDEHQDAFVPPLVAVLARRRT